MATDKRISLEVLPYSASLDGLRALAAFVVACYHAKAPWLSGGFLGVDIFFVLSGYLITRLLVDEYRTSNAIHWRCFMARRLRRLYPVFLMMLVVYLLIAPLAFFNVDFGRHLLDAIWAALYIANYSALFDAPMSRLGHVWSLAVEVQFYLLWPILMLVLLRLPKTIGIAAIAALYLISTVWRWWSFDHSTDLWLVYTRSDTHCSGLILGCLIGYLNPARIHRYWVVVAGFLLFFALTFFSWPWGATARIGFTIAEVGAVILILTQPAVLGNRVLAWLGRISYGFYLWHYLAMRVMRELQWHWLETLWAGVALGLAAAALSYYLVERRVRAPRRTELPPSGQIAIS